VDTRQITIGNDYAGAFGPGQGFTPAQRAAFSGWMDKIYDGFVHRVAEGRKLPEERVRQIAKGRVWTGVQAKELGLVDQLGGFDLAVYEAKRLAGIKADTTVSLRYLPESRGLFEGFGQAVETGADSARALVTMGRMQSDPQTRAAVRDLQRLNARPQDASVLAPGLE
jgi:protease-4